MLALVFYHAGAVAAYASSSSYITYTMCYILGTIIFSELAPGLATLAVLAVGAMAIMGKISMPMAVTVAVGMSIVFGLRDIGNMLIGVDLNGPNLCGTV